MDSNKSPRRPLKSRQHPWAAVLAKALSRAGVRPNWISLASIGMAAAAAACLVYRLYLPAAAFIQLRLLCNLMDGMVAIEGGLKSASGEVFNDFPDRLSDSLILVGAGYAGTEFGFGPALGWLAANLAILTAYVRLLGGACGTGQDFGGPMAKPQRMAVVTVACLVALVDARALLIGLGIVIVGSAVTVGLRLRRLVLQLESRP